ncbi:MAG TPA: hypothetical protein VE569_07200 [Acidimicrobiia bacterium]|nr:hypothetical protein [Acidimicrobiia bacterium]
MVAIAACIDIEASGRGALPKTVVVLGGGVGGVVAATNLRKALPRPHGLLLVDRERRRVIAPSLLWLITCERTARHITRSLDRLFRKGMEVVCGDVVEIDPERVIALHDLTPPRRESQRLEGRLSGGIARGRAGL